MLYEEIILHNFKNYFYRLTHFTSKVENVFSCDFGINFRDEDFIVLSTHWILRDSLQSYRIVTGLIGGLGLDRQRKDHKPTQGFS